ECSAARHGTEHDPKVYRCHRVARSASGACLTHDILGPYDGSTQYPVGRRGAFHRKSYGGGRLPPFFDSISSVFHAGSPHPPTPATRGASSRCPESTRPARPASPSSSTTSCPTICLRRSSRRTRGSSSGSAT